MPPQTLLIHDIFFVIAAVAADDVANANVVAQLPNAIDKQRYCRCCCKMGAYEKTTKTKISLLLFDLGIYSFFAFSLS